MIPMRSTPAQARTVLAVLSVAVLFASVPLAMAADTLWTWRDAQGRVTISDVPPPREIPDRDIVKRPSGAAGRLPDPVPSPSAASAAAAGTAAKGATSAASGPEAREARREGPPGAAASAAQSADARNAALRAEICARARRQLALIESGRRIARVDAQGGREVLDDVTIAAEVRNARQAIASECQ
jgi:hypothetical protein